MRKPTPAPSAKPDGGLLRGEERRLPEHLDEERPVPPRRLEELADHVVNVRHRPLVHLERPGQAHRDAEGAVCLPQSPQARQHCGEDQPPAQHRYSVPHREPSLDSDSQITAWFSSNQPARAAGTGGRSCASACARERSTARSTASSSLKGPSIRMRSQLPKSWPFSTAPTSVVPTGTATKTSPAG